MWIRSVIVAALFVAACHLDSTLGSTPDAAVDGAPSRPFGFRDYLKPPQPSAGDLFGDSIAISRDGTTLVIGAKGEDSNTGIDGVESTDPSDTGANLGAVYVYIRQDDSWIEQAFLKASTRSPQDEFGSTVAVSGDGNTVVVGALLEDSNGVGGESDNSFVDSGAAYVFVRSGTTWSQQAYLKASNPGAGDQFGAKLAISGDGNTIAVGTTHERSSSTGINSTPDTSLMFAGAVYVYVRTGSSWKQQAYVKPTVIGSFDQFGSSVSLSSDGSTLAVGAAGEQSASTDAAVDPNDNTANAAGSVCVFTRNGVSWSQQSYLKAPNTNVGDGFGGAVSMSGDGATLAVGATGEQSGMPGIQEDNSTPGAGAVYILTRSGSTWVHRAYLKAPRPTEGDVFGLNLAVSDDGSVLAVGAPNEDSFATQLDGDDDNETAPDSGAAYLFRQTDGTWALDHYVKASNTEAGDEFAGGTGIALSGDGATLAVTARREDSAARLVGGNQNDNSLTLCGAAYVYR